VFLRTAIPRPEEACVDERASSYLHTVYQTELYRSDLRRSAGSRLRRTTNDILPVTTSVRQPGSSGVVLGLRASNYFHWDSRISSPSASRNWSAEGNFPATVRSMCRRSAKLATFRRPQKESVLAFDTQGARLRSVAKSTRARGRPPVRKGTERAAGHFSTGGVSTVHCIYCMSTNEEACRLGDT